ncbi:MAG: ABC transporter permease [Bacteroidota bacterium]|nr:ABC transporter permease [Bacteroidota bacterium]
MIIFRLLRESVSFAFQSLRVNKLRTFLSLLGITIGIFAMISVFTVIDSLEKQIRDSVSSLGDDVIYIQKWPWEFSQDYAWWKYMNRPVPTLEEYEVIRDNAKNIEACAFMGSAMRSVSYEAVNTNSSILVATHDYKDNRDFDISKGRYFSEKESLVGSNVAIIGYNIAENLFAGRNPISKEIKVDGHRVTVIGVFDKEGSNMMSNSHDHLIMLPVNYGKRIFRLNSDELNPMILASAKSDVSIQQMNDELEILLRSHRRLSPLEEPTFALNQASMISQGVDKIFATIDIAGIIIGGFAILVGGFGIANIMFVSVKERTRMIGIQKAIGAKSGFILTQFLFEAVVLSLMGGVLGLVLIYIGTLIGSSLVDFEFILSFNNILTGLIISGVIGVISGFWPAKQAAYLDPVIAMNQA